MDIAGGKEFYVTLALTAAAVFLSFHLFFKTALTRRKLPPGPLPVPVFGNALSLKPEKGDMVDFLKRLRNDYGDVSTLFFGGTPVVMLQGYEAIYEGIVRNGAKCSVRYPLTNYVTFLGDLGGFAMSHFWKDQRKFTFEIFRDHGVGSEQHECRIHEEITHLLKELDKHATTAFNVQEDVRKAVANVILEILLGKRFDYHDQTFEQLLYLAERFDALVPTADLSLIFPYLKYIPGKWRNLSRIREPLIRTITGLIDERSDKDESINSLNYVDSFLRALDKKEPLQSNKNDLVSNVFALFAGGTDTTTAALVWAILCCLAFPEVQRKMSSEIRHVVGGCRYPSLQDRPRMPYTEAVITEVLRLPACPVFTLPYTVCEPMSVCGHQIPAGVAIMANVFSACCDEKRLSAPLAFEPGRHLDAAGNYVKPDKSFIPFSTGRRACPGEALARSEIFLFLTAIVQAYEMKPETTEKLDFKTSTTGSIYVPHPFKCTLIRRK